MTEPTASSGALSRSACSPATKIVMNGEEVHSQQGLTSQQLQLHNPNRTALAISVTTGSRGEPGGVNANGFAAQYQQSGPSLSLGVEAMLQSSQRHGLRGTSAMVFCGGGITLPEKRQIDPQCIKLGSTGSHNQSQSMPFTMATHQARKVVTIISAPQTKPKIVKAAPSPSDVIIGIHTNNTKVYSSACRASVNAHQLALTRRVNSAPGLAGRTGPSDLSVDRSKFKYQKVIGGSSTSATNARRTSLVRTFPGFEGPCCLRDDFSNIPFFVSRRRHRTNCLLKYSSTPCSNLEDTARKTFAVLRVPTIANRRLFNRRVTASD